jgi:class 3 adenylate cyclase/sugar lactone lactonase YvrE
MASSSARRRLAAVLFLDIVGSTKLAAELGDSAWRVVLGRFRQAVRRELKRFDGREQDTAGDGFFATFSGPAQALRSAAAIVAAVQELGLDVRAGVHFGECEQIDGKLGGIAVHLGARVMALAGPAEVLATATVRDLVAGSGAAFEDLGAHELKGVDGVWAIWRLRSLEAALPPPLAPEVAAARLAALTAVRPRRRRWPLAAGALVLVAAATVGVVLATHGGRAAIPPVAVPASLLRLDASTGRIVATTRDRTLGCACGSRIPNLWAVDGTLWERTSGHTIAIRSLDTGRLLRTIPIPVDVEGFAIGYGAVWFVDPGLITSTTANPVGTVERIDELSGRVVATVKIPGNLGNGTIVAGNGAIWVLDQNGVLWRVNPATSRITGQFQTKAPETGDLVAAAGYEWIGERLNYGVLRYDPSTRRATTFHFGEQPWHLLPVESAHSRSLWLLDQQDDTITSVNPETGEPGHPIGLTGVPGQAVLARGSIWVAAGDVIDRFSLTGGGRSTITLPKGTNATSIAVDPATGALWVANSRRGCVQTLGQDAYMC